MEKPSLDTQIKKISLRDSGKGFIGTMLIIGAIGGFGVIAVDSAASYMKNKQIESDKKHPQYHTLMGELVRTVDQSVYGNKDGETEPNSFLEIFDYCDRLGKDFCQYDKKSGTLLVPDPSLDVLKEAVAYGYVRKRTFIDVETEALDTSTSDIDPLQALNERLNVQYVLPK